MIGPAFALSLSPIGFGVLVWGTIGLVLCVLGYQLYAVLTDVGWIEPSREQ